MSTFPWNRKGSQLGSLKESYQDGRYVILKPKKVGKENLKSRRVTRNIQEVIQWLGQVQLLDHLDAVALDTETSSLKVFGNPQFQIVGIGLGHGESAIYLDLKGKPKRAIEREIRLIQSETNRLQIPLIAFNLFYDASVIAQCLGEDPRDTNPKSSWMNWLLDVQFVSRMLSSEGWVGQTFGLKTVMKDLLLWEDTNETDRDEWLLYNGYIKSKAGVDEEDDRDTVTAKISNIHANIEAGKQYHIDKSQMWRVPSDILGEYCMLDCYATYQAYREIALPAMRKYTTDFFTWYVTEVVQMTIRNCIDNYFYGIPIDLGRLNSYDAELEAEIEAIRRKFYRQFKAEISLINARGYSELGEPEGAEKFKKGTDRPAEVAKYTKSGKLSGNYLTYIRKLHKWNLEGPQYRADFLRRLVKRKQVKRAIRLGVDLPKALRKYAFNINSGEDKREVLYTGVNIQVVREHTGSERDQIGKFIFVDRDIEMDMTDSGELPVDKKAQMALGDRGKLLSEYNLLVKRRQFVQGTSKASGSDGLMHMPFKTPGTLTLRLSGGYDRASSGDKDIASVSCQNIPKVKGFLEAWRPPFLDWVIASTDFASQEDYVLAELSKDAATLALYSEGAPKNDPYLFALALAGIGAEELKAEGYDPYKPTPEAIDSCKKKYKALRQAGKIIKLSDAYGSGFYKKWQALRIQGFKYTLDEVKVMHDGFQEAYAGTKLFGKKLMNERSINGGFVLDGLGFPTCIDRRKERDCLAGDTLVRVLNKGWIRLDNIRLDDVVWDGESWVNHEGLIDKGVKDTISVDDVRCTPDHLLLGVSNEWIRAEERSSDVVRINEEPSYSWSDVWSLACNLGRALLGTQRR